MSEREPGSVIVIDGQELRTACGHSYVTCHTSTCFKPTWKLEGYDTFSSESYPLGAYPGADNCKPSYDSYEAALADAWLRLAELERTQPSSSSGGQAGIQDRVFIIHPGGRRERVCPFYSEVRADRVRVASALMDALAEQYDELRDRMKAWDDADYEGTP